MRRVDAEGDSRGVRDQKPGGARAKTRLRREALELLERRELLSTSTSTLPSPTVLTAPSLLAPRSLSAVVAAGALTSTPSANSPSVSVDPINPLKMVATWIDHDAAGYNPGAFVAPITSYAQGAFSTDGGVNWTAFPSGFGPGSMNIQEDFSLARPMVGVNVFTQVTDASFAFDRNENVYLLTSSHNATNSAGVLDVQRFKFAGNAPSNSQLTTPVYSWDQADSLLADSAVTPVLCVDINLASFTDPISGTTQTDPYSGNIYVAWSEDDANTYNGIAGFDPNTIRMSASSNQGLYFTHDAYVDNSSNANNHVNAVITVPPTPNTPLHDSPARYSAPQIAISQGTSAIAGGQVSIVYDDYGTQAGQGFDRILVQSNTLGGTSEQYNPDGTLLPNPIQSGVAATTTTPFVPGVTDTPIAVNITDLKFTTLQALDVTTKIAWPDLSGLAVLLIPSPSANAYLTTLFGARYPGYISLMGNPQFGGDLGAGDGTVNTGPNLGATAINPAANPSFAGGGTVFDQEAVRRISDGNVGGTADGHFKADGNFFILALQGLGASTLNGTWTLRTVDTKGDTSTNPKFVVGVTLNFSSGINPGNLAGAAGAESVVADMNSLFIVPVQGIDPTNPASARASVTHTNNPGSQLYDKIGGTTVSGAGTTFLPTQAPAVLPAPVIASDNTLGAFNAHPGRLYVAFTGQFSNAAAGNTDVFMAFSDDYGKNWSTVRQVNDDNSTLDGFSASTPGGPLGRAQYEPLIAVEQSTGDLVVSFLDARNDPSNARVADYVAVSGNGGATFAANVYANETFTALNAVTGTAVNLGPIPDNQSVLGGVQDTLGFGAHQALAVVNGRIIPFWSSNQNLATRLNIVDSILSLPAGPRIIAATQGPVGTAGDTTNTTRLATDGTTLANTILLTFDRPINPLTLTTNSVVVSFKSADGTITQSLTVTGVSVAASNARGATQMKVTFSPPSGISPVGTYSYAVIPTGIADRSGNVMDQNGNGTPGQVGADDYVVGQPPGFVKYASGTLPIIVPGPHVVSASVVKSATDGTVLSTGADNLVLNNTANTIQVTFDRNINVSTFGPGNISQVLSLFGPTGAVSLAGVVITPVTYYSGPPTGNLVAYSGGGFANIFRITFAPQQISGTYTLQLGTLIQAQDGSTVDANLNAGLDMLRGTATTGVTVPVTYNAASPQVPYPVATASTDVNGVVSPSVQTSTLVVPDNFPIQGDTLTIAGLTVTLNVTYPNDPDLTIYLVAPGLDALGKPIKILLIGAAGSGTSNANFSRTTFSDKASTSITKASAPYFGSFQPGQSLANLATVYNLNAQGTWGLEIDNKGNSTGTLNSWSLNFRRPVSASGLGEANDDQTTLSFRAFNLAANNPLASSTWTAIGPAGVRPTSGQGTLAGEVSTIAIDPTDKTGNTVYVGTASGGIWKTNNFLTTSLSGPTYVPLTDFGPSFGQNIGSLSVFPRNNDPNQTVIFAGTGFAQQRTNATAGNPNIDFNTGLGAGMLRSIDGGKTWQELSFLGASTYKVVVDPSPTPTNQIIIYVANNEGLFQSLDSGNSFTLLKAGNATDILLDPNSKSPITGNLGTLYAAFSYVNMPGYQPGNKTSLVGVYVSINQGQTFLPVNGGLGKDPLIVTPGFPASPIPVLNIVTPNNPNAAFIALAKPALAGNTAVDLNYQGWLYAAVENPNGTFQGLYVTKDAGEDWTLVQLPNIPGNASVKAVVPTNATTAINSFDPTSSNFSQQGLYDLTLTVDPSNANIVYIGGSHDFQESGMIRVDLTNLHDAHNFTAGSNNRSDGGLLFDNGQGGATDAVIAKGPATYLTPSGPRTQILNLRYAPNDGSPGTSPFDVNATLVVANTANFLNDGTGVTWSLFDQPLKANPGDALTSTNLHDVITSIDPITGRVRMIFADDEGVFTALVNPDGTLNNGIGTDGEPNYSRNGNLQDQQILKSAAQPSVAASTAAGAEVYASGQSTLAAQSDPNVLTNGNLTWDNSAVLNPGSTSPRNTTANQAISSVNRSGVGIATDSTGLSTTLYEFDIPILGGNLTDFFRVNQFGQTTGLASNVGTDFPANGYRGDAHQGGVLVPPVTTGPLVNGQIPQGDFTVNPIDGDQILIASATGNLYETTNKGIQWVPIGTSDNYGASDNINFPGFDSAGKSLAGTAGRTAPLPVQLSAIAYGAPDPSSAGGAVNLNNFVYVGTTGRSYSDSGNTPTNSDPYIDPVDGLKYNDGKVFFTQAGGQGWINASQGLDGSSVVGIYPAPDRGSHAAYAVTLTGIFYSPDTVALAGSGQAVWTNITGNLGSIQRAAFGNPAYQQSAFAPFNYNPINLTIPPTTGTPNLAGPVPYNPVYNSAYGGFSGIVADYRYEIPAATNATQGTNIYFPVLYASGYGGVFRSIDNGTTWTAFPNTSFDAAPVDGGYLPNVDVTNLQLVLGNINPDTGHAVQSPGDPEVLIASTFGRGDFAIRLSPDVIPTTIHFDSSLPLGGSDSGASPSDLITNVLNPYLDGVGELSNYGNNVTIKLFDQTNGPGRGTLLGQGVTNTLGQFGHETVPGDVTTFVSGIIIGQLQQPDGSYVAVIDPSFFASSTALGDKVVGIQATDVAGAVGNTSLFRYTLDTINPNTPQAPVLDPTNDTGRFNNDSYTNLSVPAPAGPDAALNLVAPNFEVTTALPQANLLTPTPISLTVELLRSTSPSGPFFLIASTQSGVISVDGKSETYTLSDAIDPSTNGGDPNTTGLAYLAAAGINTTFYYEAIQVDFAGNVSSPASNERIVYVDTIAPATPATPVTVTVDYSKPNKPEPTFSVANVPAGPTTAPTAGDQVLLYRSVNGATPTRVLSNDPINTTGSPATLQLTDLAGAFPDGVYTYYVALLDVYGNISPLSAGTVVTINTQSPPQRPFLVTDTGRYANDDVTDIASPAPTPGTTPTFNPPAFSVPAATQVIGQLPVATVELRRSDTLNGPYTLVGSSAYNGSPTTVIDSDPTLLTRAAAGLDQIFYYEADTINSAGLASGFSPPLAVLINTLTPASPTNLRLDPASNTGLDPTRNITTTRNPTLDLDGLLPVESKVSGLGLNPATFPQLGDIIYLYRKTGGGAFTQVGMSVINTTNVTLNNVKITDTTAGGVPDGVYTYVVSQQDLAGNISPFNSLPVTVTINNTFATKPTIKLIDPDDSGLPLHPNVTNVRLPHFSGTAPYNASPNFPLDIINVSTGAVIARTFPAANGTYLALTDPTLLSNSGAGLADGTYTLEARTTNINGNYSFSSLLTVTIKAIPPKITPSLMLLPADDTGIKLDGVTANHNPRFTGITDPGDIVTLYAIINGQLTGPQATTTSSGVNGSFTFKLPYSLTDGTAQLVARTSDIANNVGSYSSPFQVSIISTAGDYLGFGKAQLSVFDPRFEAYFVRNLGAAQVDITPGRDIPIQYDLNGDGATDLTAYRFNTAEYFGYVSNGTGIDQQYGFTNSGLPVSGYYGNSGTFIYGAFQPSSATWALALPQPGGLVFQFGVPKIDVPVPAAFDGNNSTELAVFRPTTIFGGDADSFSVIGPKGFYEVSFTSPAVAAKGFVYRPGDIAAPADYDGIGRDEFAVYRPSTGQFFILNVPNVANSSTWTLRTVTLNLPGGPNVNDVPTSADYDGNGKIDPTVYRPSNSTFYMIHSSTNLQENIQFGAAGQAVASAGPILYRLTALKGAYSSTAGYYGTPGGGPVGANSLGGGGGAHAFSIASAGTSTSASSVSGSANPLSTTVAVASPIAVTRPATRPAQAATTPGYPTVTIGALAARSFVPATTTASPAHTTTRAKAQKATAHATAAPVKVHAAIPAHHPKVALVAAKVRTASKLTATSSVQHLVLAKKGVHKA